MNTLSSFDSRPTIQYGIPTANAGNDSAQHNLGLCYRDGEGVKRNLRWARYWLGRSAKAGNKRARKALADLRNT